MKIRAKRDVVVMLTLTESEARTLVELLLRSQPSDVEKEPAAVTEFRKQIFDSLRRCIDAMY
jgi:hypothetical protein